MDNVQVLNLDIKGLYTSPNNLSGAPQGALSEATNLVVIAKNLAVSRNGQTQFGDPLTVASGQINKIFNYSSSLIVNYDDKMAYDSTGSGDFVDYSGTWQAFQTGYKIRSLETAKNFYFNSSEGVYKLDALTASPVHAGAPQALGGSGALTGVSGFMANNSSVAYRILWGYTDLNMNLILGAPSQRIIVSNSAGGTRDVNLTALIPDGITTTYFYQLYRSFGTASASDEPNDELQLVQQGTPSAAQIAAKSITILDNTPYSLMRTALYTNPSQQGIENANLQPPACLDMDVFKNCSFYANTNSKQRLSLALLTAGTPGLGFYTDATVGTTNGSPNLTGILSTTDLRVGMRVVGTGIQSDTRILQITGGTTVTMNKNATATGTVSIEFQDRVTIANVDYWAGSAANASTNTFLVSTGGSPGANIDATAISLIQIINTSASNTAVYGFYISGIEDLPGQFLIEERQIGGDPFVATSTVGTSFSPALPEQYAITGNTAANPTVVTSANHGLTTGDQITIYNSNSTPSIDGTYTVTVLTSNTFTIPVNVTVLGTSGYWILASLVVTSSSERIPNRVYLSKQGQPESVPIYRFFDVGAANFPIQRCIALRDAIIFLKGDGVWKIAGETFENMTVSLLDGTVFLKGPESAVAFNNQIFCMTTQGVVAISDSGVRIISVPIEDRLLQLSSEQYPYFATATFGVGYESERLYMLFTVTETTDQFATQAFVFNTLSESWTRWTMNRTCGVVNPTVGKLFMGETDTGQVMIERKSYTNTDFADKQFDILITAVNSTTEIEVFSSAEMAVGMTLLQNSRNCIIEEINGTVITVSAVNGLQDGAAVVYEPILNLLEWHPIDAENPGILKQYSESVFFFKNAAFREIDASFATNISTVQETVPLANNTGSGWGMLPWGKFPWGGVLGGSAALRTYVPQEKQMCNWMYLSLETEEAFTGFSLQGVSLMFSPMSSWIK